MNVAEYIKNNKKEIIFVTLISFAALFLRIISLKFSGDLWIDEIYSYYFASKNSIPDVIKSLYSEDLHTPLYFIFLHLWIKFFSIFGVGENDAIMRILGFIPSFLVVPFSYFIGKEFFNKKTGYFAASILAISPFLIYYTTELRFYGTACFLTLLSSYYFVKFMQNPGKKETTALLVSNLLLMYTFNISFVYVFFQFLTAIFLLSEKEKVIKWYSLMVLLYIPGFIMALHGIFSYKNSICSFSKDIFIYKPAFISIFLQSFFTGNFFYATQNNYDYNETIVKNMFNAKNVYLILFPIIFSVLGFIKGLISKNKTLFIFLIPSFIFLLFEFIAASLGLMSLTVRYTLIAYPVIILTLCFGFSLFKNVKVMKILCALFLISILAFNFLKINPIKKEVEFGTPVKAALEKLNINEDDYILIPVMGKLYKRYTPKKAHYLDFEITDMLLNDVRKYYHNVFNDDIVSRLEQKNARELLYDYTVWNQSSPELEKYLTGYFKDLKKGSRFIVLINNMNTIKSMSALYTKTAEEKRRLYYKNSLYYMLTTRIVFDIIDISNKNLTLENHFIIEDSKKSDNNTGVFVFIK